MIPAAPHPCAAVFIPPNGTGPAGRQGFSHVREQGEGTSSAGRSRGRGIGTSTPSPSADADGPLPLAGGALTKAQQSAGLLNGLQSGLREPPCQPAAAARRHAPITRVAVGGQIACRYVTVSGCLRQVRTPSPACGWPVSPFQGALGSENPSRYNLLKCADVQLSHVRGNKPRCGPAQEAPPERGRGPRP